MRCRSGLAFRSLLVDAVVVTVYLRLVRLSTLARRLVYAVSYFQTGVSPVTVPTPGTTAMPITKSTYTNQTQPPYLSAGCQAP